MLSHTASFLTTVKLFISSIKCLKKSRDFKSVLIFSVHRLEEAGRPTGAAEADTNVEVSGARKDPPRLQPEGAPGARKPGQGRSHDLQGDPPKGGLLPLQPGEGWCQEVPS